MCVCVCVCVRTRALVNETVCACVSGCVRFMFSVCRRTEGFQCGDLFLCVFSVCLRIECLCVFSVGLSFFVFCFVL